MDDLPVRVLVVEDHELFAYVVRLYLERDPELIVIDAVHTAAAAIEHPHLQDVDVVLIDVGLPGTSGIEAVRLLHEANPAVRIVVMSGSGHRAACERDAFAAGAAAYLEKGPLDEELASTLVAVGRGGMSTSTERHVTQPSSF